MRRFGRHEELTNLAAFLMSNMAEYINGECVVIDGGQWLRGAGEFNIFLDLPDTEWTNSKPPKRRHELLAVIPSEAGSWPTRDLLFLAPLLGL